jgi:alpha-glucosidase (family GH31 glycosyl hydrolase)
MNEPSSTCTGYCYQSERPADAIKYDIPYWPGMRDLEVQALGLDTLNTGLPIPKRTGKYRNHLDARSLYAMKESQATYEYLKQGNKRPFILSRSSSPGI